MLDDRYRFDGKETIELNELQHKIRDSIIYKLESGEYKSETVKCLCGGSNFQKLAEKDRYGIPVITGICLDCGLLLTNPRMTQSSYNEFYDYEYRRLYGGLEKPDEQFYNEQYNHGEQIYEFVKELLKRDAKVLEIGCGAGGILKFFSEKGCRVIGIDLGGEYIEYGQTFETNLTKCSLAELVSIDCKKYDLVILSHVLEHMLDVEVELSLIDKLLEADGLIYIEAPGIYNLHYSYDCDFLRYLQNAHTYHFNLDTLSQIMRLNGFSLVSGNETIQSIFKKSDAEINNITDYSKQVYSYLVDLEENRHKYKELLTSESNAFDFNEYRKERFNWLSQELKNYKEDSVYIYGTGNHTKIMLEAINNLNNKIAGLIDYDQKKEGNYYLGFPIFSLENVIKQADVIIISSDVYQNVIYDRIKYLESTGVRVIKLYEKGIGS